MDRVQGNREVGEWYGYGMDMMPHWWQEPGDRKMTMASFRMVVIESDDASAVVPALTELLRPRMAEPTAAVPAPLPPVAVVAAPAPLALPASPAPVEEPAQAVVEERKPADAPGTKTCKRCGNPKLAADFAANRDTCKQCIVDAAEATRLKNRGTKVPAPAAKPVAPADDLTREAYLYIEECVRQRVPIEPDEVQEHLPDHYGDAETRRFIQWAMDKIAKTID